MRTTLAVALSFCLAGAAFGFSYNPNGDNRSEKYALIVAGGSGRDGNSLTHTMTAIRAYHALLDNGFMARNIIVLEGDGPNLLVDPDIWAVGGENPPTPYTGEWIEYASSWYEAGVWNEARRDYDFTRQYTESNDDWNGFPGANEPYGGSSFTVDGAATWGNFKTAISILYHGSGGTMDPLSPMREEDDLLVWFANTGGVADDGMGGYLYNFYGPYWDYNFETGDWYVNPKDTATGSELMSYIEILPHRDLTVVVGGQNGNALWQSVTNQEDIVVMAATSTGRVAGHVPVRTYEGGPGDGDTPRVDWGYGGFMEELALSMNDMNERTADANNDGVIAMAELFEQAARNDRLGPMWEQFLPGSTELPRLSGPGFHRAWKIFKPGDCNRDGQTDGSDLAIVALNWGRFVSDRGEGDVDGSGFVDGTDLALVGAWWQFGAAWSEFPYAYYPLTNLPDGVEGGEYFMPENSGVSLAPPAIPSIPEPMSLSLVMASLAIAALRRRSR